MAWEGCRKHSTQGLGICDMGNKKMKMAHKEVDLVEEKMEEAAELDPPPVLNLADRPVMAPLSKSGVVYGPCLLGGVAQRLVVRRARGVKPTFCSTEDLSIDERAKENVKVESVICEHAFDYVWSKGAPSSFASPVSQDGRAPLALDGRALGWCDLGTGQGVVRGKPCTASDGLVLYRIPKSLNLCRNGRIWRPVVGPFTVEGSIQILLKSRVDNEVVYGKGTLDSKGTLTARYPYGWKEVESPGDVVMQEPGYTYTWAAFDSRNELAGEDEGIAPWAVDVPGPVPRGTLGKCRRRDMHGWVSYRGKEHRFSLTDGLVLCKAPAARPQVAK
eukprot:Sspe_Gene.81493::Locus_52297_Transcript_1_1_Confidence_1.000_Length_1367::g.81493::m.81493